MATIGTPARQIGDPERIRRLALGLSVGLDDHRLDLSGLWDGFGNIAGPLAQAGSPLWRIARGIGLARSDTTEAPPLARQFIGLKHLIDTAHDQAPVPYAQSQIEIAVPFSQIAIISDQSVFGLDHLERSLTEAIETEFGAYIDPRQPPRVRFLQSRDLGGDPGGSRHLRVYIGNGIFLPPAQLAQRSQAGHLWLRRPGEDDIYVARLPDGSEAAFHDGQTGVAFSGSVALTPATCREVLLKETEEHGAAFFVGRLRDNIGVTFQAWQADRQRLEPWKYRLTLPDSNHVELDENIILEPYRWYGVRRIGRGSPPPRQPAFEFCYAPDSARHGRLHRQRPQGPHLQVTGFQLPDPQRAEGVARVWVDFDAEGHLVADSLTPRRRSLVIGPTGLAGVFQRDGGTYEERGIGIDRQPTLDIGGRQLRIMELPGPPNGRLMAQAMGGAGLGYLALPARHEAPRGFLVGPALTSEAADRACDWLNAAGLVEARDEEAPPAVPGVGAVRFQPYVGLASWHVSAGTGAATLTWDPAGNLRVARDSGGSQSVQPGSEVMLGPLRVRYEPG